ncbi:MAG: sigma-70 family RNA polymerase sigma factor [Bacilli bacterium]
MKNLDILQYEKLVYSIINKYSYYYDKEDLYQVGMMGLKKAFDKFKDTNTSKFSTYAYLFIKGEVLKFIREDKSIKVNNDLLSLNKKINIIREMLSHKLMKTVTNCEIALYLNIDESLIDECIMACEMVKSLDFVVNEDEKELNLYDSVNYVEKGYDEEILDLKNQLGLLNSNEQRLIQYRYFEDLNQEDTSTILGISQVQVSRCEKKILEKLKNRLVV